MYVCVYVPAYMCVRVCVIVALPKLLPPPSHQECEYPASYLARHQLPGSRGEKRRDTDFLALESLHFSWT